MVTLRKGSVVITVEAWLRSQHPYSCVSAERYVELYRAELEREGWTINGKP